MKINYDFIDFDVRELVRILNDEKGFATISSCSGVKQYHDHYVENRLQVAFKHPYTDIVFPDEITNIEYNENTLYIDYIGSSDEEVLRVINEWTEHFKAHPEHKEEVKTYSYSIIVQTKNNRILYVDTTYDKGEAYNKLKELNEKKKYRSVKMRRTALECW